MARKANLTGRLDEEIKLLKTRAESGGPEMHTVCTSLEGIMRDLKVFDQRRHHADQMTDDLNKRFEALVLSLEKITKILKENGMI